MIGREDALIMQAPYEAVSEDRRPSAGLRQKKYLQAAPSWPAVDAAYGPGNFVTEGGAFRDSYM
ncbi:MAG: hypothetical protein ACLUOI_12215 [Eisenbergiella sp.]